MTKLELITIIKDWPDNLKVCIYDDDNEVIYDVTSVKWDNVSSEGGHIELSGK